MGVRRLSRSLLFLGLVGAMLGGGGACGSGGGCDTLCDKDFWNPDQPPGVADVRQEIEDGESVNGYIGGYDEGLTPLHLAVAIQDPAVVRLLLENGAEVGRWSSGEKGKGLTALHISVTLTKKENPEVVRALLESGADPDVDTRGLGTPIEVAAAESDDDPTQVKILLEFGADPDLEGTDKGGALAVAVRADNLTIARVLLDAGANMNGPNDQGAVPAIGAMESPGMIRLLAERGADFNIANSRGVTPCEIGRLELREATRPLELAIREVCPQL